MRIADLPGELSPQTAPGVWDEVLEILRKVQPPGAQARVLNAGAGRGGMSLLLRERGYEVESIDLHPEHFRVPEMDCRAADLLVPLTYKDHEFDAVVAVEVMEHLENPWLFFREAIRILRTGGIFAFSSPNAQSLMSRLLMLSGKCPPYFREQSFVGCYHVTPIFDWAVTRCCQTADAELVAVAYSRVGWPRSDDLPRVWVPRIQRLIWSMLPCNRLFGEITVYCVRKTQQREIRVPVGVHGA